MKLTKKAKRFFEKELLWKFPIMMIAFIVCIKIVQYLDNTRPDPDLLVGLLAGMLLIITFLIFALGIIWLFFSVNPFLYKLILRSTQKGISK